MEHLGPLVNAALVVVMTLIITWFMKDRFDAVNRQFDAVNRQLDGVNRRLDGHDERFDRIEKEQAEIKADVTALKALVAAIQARLDDLSREVVGLRTDLTQIALQVGARPRPETA